MPGLEVEYQNFLKRVHEETDDPQWNIENHPARKILNHYSEGFCKWVGYLENLLLLQKGGYPFEKNDLDVIEWKALALLQLLGGGPMNTKKFANNSSLA